MAQMNSLLLQLQDLKQCLVTQLLQLIQRIKDIKIMLAKLSQYQS